MRSSRVGIRCAHSGFREQAKASFATYHLFEALNVLDGEIELDKVSCRHPPTVPGELKFLAKC